MWHGHLLEKAIEGTLLGIAIVVVVVVGQGGSQRLGNGGETRTLLLEPVFHGPGSPAQPLFLLGVEIPKEGSLAKIGRRRKLFWTTSTTGGQGTGGAIWK